MGGEGCGRGIRGHGVQSFMGSMYGPHQLKTGFNCDGRIPEEGWLYWDRAAGFA